MLRHMIFWQAWNPISKPPLQARRKKQRATAEAGIRRESGIPERSMCATAVQIPCCATVKIAYLALQLSATAGLMASKLDLQLSPSNLAAPASLRWSPAGAAGKARFSLIKLPLPALNHVDPGISAACHHAHMDSLGSPTPGHMWPGCARPHLAAPRLRACPACCSMQACIRSAKHQGWCVSRPSIAYQFWGAGM